MITQKRVGILIILILGLILISGCTTITKKDNNTPEQIAQGFGILWTQKDYASAYELFTPELKALRTKEDFVKFANTKNDDLSLIYDKIVQQDDKSVYAYYTVSSGIIERKMPPVKMELTNEGWKINAFAPYFEDSCADELCKLGESNCEKLSCDSTTNFECKYEDVEPCICKDELDCSYDKPLCDNSVCKEKECSGYNDCPIDPNSKTECEAKGLKFEAWAQCIEGKCVQRCRENEYTRDQL